MLIDSTTNKQKILDHFLAICLLEGWNQKALELAFLKAEIDIKLLPLIFENGSADIADFFISNIDKKMEQTANDIDFAALKVRDKIKTLVKIRLQINQQYQPQLQKLINFYAHPQNLGLALKNSYKTADLMWKIAGDNATDFNFYSKRIILAKIYIRVLACFAQDQSENHQKTFSLLDKEIEKVMRFTAFKFKAKNYFNQAGDLVKKAEEIKADFCQHPKNFIKKLPFFRLHK